MIQQPCTLIVIMCVFYISFENIIAVQVINIINLYSSNTFKDVNPKEKGFVLKWYFNETLIYQWIPDRPPQVFSYFKNFISFDDQVPAHALMLRYKN